MKKGSSPSDRSVSCQSSRNIATTVEMTTTRLEKTLLAVSVTTAWMPPTSFCQPALDLARPRVGEEAQRQPLQVRVQRVAQVLHDALADDVVEVRLADADQAADDGHQDHQRRHRD